MDYVLNFSAISGIVLLLATNIVTVDIDSWDSMSFVKILTQIPSSNWENYMD